jgi:hypothetical protein
VANLVCLQGRTECLCRSCRGILDLLSPCSWCNEQAVVVSNGEWCLFGDNGQGRGPAVFVGCQIERIWS